MDHAHGQQLGFGNFFSEGPVGDQFFAPCWGIFGYLSSSYHPIFCFTWRKDIFMHHFEHTAVTHCSQGFPAAWGCPALEQIWMHCPVLQIKSWYFLAAWASCYYCLSWVSLNQTRYFYERCSFTVDCSVVLPLNPLWQPTQQHIWETALPGFWETLLHAALGNGSLPSWSIGFSLRMAVIMLGNKIHVYIRCFTL